MSARLLQLERLLAIRQMQERLAEGRQAQAVAELRKVERGLDEAERSVEAAVQERMQALCTGDRGAWALADAMRTVAERRKAGLAQELSVREAAAEQSRQASHEARRQREQVERMLHAAEAQMELEEQRRAQALGDDRFAARQRWMALQASRRAT